LNKIFDRKSIVHKNCAINPTLIRAFVIFGLLNKKANANIIGA
jgi:hypothetical protein